MNQNVWGGFVHILGGDLLGRALLGARGRLLGLGDVGGGCLLDGGLLQGTIGVQVSVFGGIAGVAGSTREEVEDDTRQGAGNDVNHPLTIVQKKKVSSGQKKCSLHLEEPM